MPSPLGYLFKLLRKSARNVGQDLAARWLMEEFMLGQGAKLADVGLHQIVSGIGKALTIEEGAVPWLDIGTKLYTINEQLKARSFKSRVGRPVYPQSEGYVASVILGRRRSSRRR